MTQTAIEINGLSKYYRKFRALHDVSFEVNEGDFFGFLGPNGAGKTTTIHAVTGLVNYQMGRIRVFGHDVTGDYRKARALIGLAPQEFNFDPFLTAEQILVFEAGYFGVSRRVARKRAHQLLDEFELFPFRKHDFRKLSGGMKRRLLIARALVHEPKILILDEPTAGIDLELRHRLWNFFKRINGEGVTVLLTTHYIEEAEKLCSRIGVIHKGEMVAVDEKQKLMSRMGQNTIEVRLNQKLNVIPLDFEHMGAELLEGGDRIRLREEEETLAQILRAVHLQGIGVVGVEVKRTTLEDVFRHLTA